MCTFSPAGAPKKDGEGGREGKFFLYIKCGKSLASFTKKGAATTNCGGIHNGEKFIASRGMGMGG